MKKIVKIERTGQGWQLEFSEEDIDELDNVGKLQDKIREVLSVRTWEFEEDAKRNVIEFLFPKKLP